MMEVVANLAFSHPSVGRLRAGAHVLIHDPDPAVGALINAGYLRMVRRGMRGDDGGVVDSVGAAPVSGAGVGVGVDGLSSLPPQEEVTDGEGGHRPAQESGIRASGD